MPGVDLLDAFAELVVCVVFNLPHDPPPPSTSSDDDDDLVGANSSGTTQIFSRVTSMEERRSQHPSSFLHVQTPSQTSPNTREVASFTAVHTATLSCPVPPLSQLSSTHSVDLYPGGIWNPLARLQQTPAATASSITTPVTLLPASLAVATHGSHTGSDTSTPRSSGPSTDRSVGIWSRLLGGSGVLQTPPRTASSAHLGNTGMTTTASSYVQLTEEDLGMMNASGRVGGVSGWTGISTPASFAPYPSSQHQEWHGAGDSRGAATPSGLSTPLYEASPAASCTHLPQQQQQQQQARLNAHGLYIAGQRSTSPPGANSQASSSSEFVVL